MQGQSDIPLNSEGRRQAAVLAERLVAEGVPVAAVYSSHLSRAAETARIVAGAFGLRVVLDPRLRERNSGAAEGLCRREVKRRFGGGEGRALDLEKVPGVEPWSDLVRRMGEVLTEIARRHLGQTVVVVSHGGAIANWLQGCFGLPERPVIPNGERVRVQYHPSAGWKLLSEL